MTGSLRPIDFSEIRGLRLGHATDARHATGVTVVRFASAASVAIDVRGGASATYDTSSLGLEATFGRRWAVFFAGGSLYGLDTARGVRTRLLEEGLGQRAFGRGARVVPISGAAIFDLYDGRVPTADYESMGYSAARDARSRSPALQGRVGAGTGARVAKYLGGRRSVPGGVGAAAVRVGTSASVGVLAVVNAVGAVQDPRRGRWVAAARDAKGKISPPNPARWASVGRTNTTLALVATDLSMTRPELYRLAMIASTGLARAIAPFHTTTDGDVVFSASTEALRRRRPDSRPGETVDRLGSLAADLAVEAVLSAVSTRR